MNDSFSVYDSNTGKYVNVSVPAVNMYEPPTMAPNSNIPMPYVYPAPIPAVCPGCGRCNTCGRPKEQEFKITYGQTP